MFTYPCGQCHTPIQAENTWIGLQARCPRCQAVTTVPAPDGTTLPDDRRPRPQPPTAPVQVPGYEVLGELGRGGMGVVYKARHLALNRLVALKMVRGGGPDSGDESSRFRREAEAVARLQHPNIVQVFEVGECAGQPFFSLEFCPGGTLAQRAADAVPPHQAAVLVETLARAMHHAHAHGIVHRDLKPGNILLAADGTPKVTDFGLARFLDQTQQTQPGAVMGTPSYMAPEQAEGRVAEVGPCTDIWALGVILYELLTGRAPFKAGSVMETLAQVVLADPVPPVRLNPTCPRDLEAVCLKCLGKRPRDRYAGADALADDLARWLQGKPTLARPAGPPERLWRWARRNRGVAALASSLALILVTVAVASTIFAVRFDQLATEAGETAASERQAREAATEAQAGEAAERRKAVAARRDSQLQQARLLASAGWAGYAEDPVRALPWFVESLRLAEGHPREETLARLRLDSLLVQYPPCRLWFGVRTTVFDPTGALLATTGDDGVARVWDAATGDPVSVPLEHQGPVLTAAFSPDGKRLVTGGMDRQARVWEIATGKVVQSVPCPAAVWYTRFTPDGGSLLLGWGDDVFATFDLANGAGPEGRALGRVLCFSNDGQLLVRAGGRAGPDASTVEVWDLARHRLHCPAIILSRTALAASLSDNTTRLAIATEGGNKGSPAAQVSVWNLSTGKAILEARSVNGKVTCLALSGDGRHLAWGAAEVVQLLDLSEIQGQPVTVAAPGRTTHAVFSPDNRRLALLLAGSPEWPVPSEDLSARRQSRRESAAVWVVDVATGSPLFPPLAQHADSDQLQFAPVGNRLVVTAGARGSGEACLWDLPEVVPYSQALPDSRNIYDPQFAADGRTVHGFPSGGDVRLTWGLPGGQLVDRGTPGGPVSTRPVMVTRFSPIVRKVAVTRLDRHGRLVTEDRSQTVFTALQTTYARTGDEAALRRWERQAQSSLALTLPGRQTIVAFSDDASLVYATEFTERGTFGRVWDTATLTPRTPPLEHYGHVTAASFNPDNTLLATVEEGRAVRLWNVADGEPITARILSHVPLLGVSLGSEPRWLVAAPGDPDLLLLWDLHGPDRPVEQLRWLTQILSRSRLDPTRTPEPLESPDMLAAWEMLQWHSPPARLEGKPEVRRAWHRHRSEECFKGRAWELADLHLTAMLEDRSEADLERGRLHTRRGYVRASLGQYELALVDYTRGTELGHTTPQARHEHALVHLALSQEDGYRRECARLLAGSSSGDGEQALLAVWTAVLRPGVIDDPTQLAALAEEVVRRRPRDTRALLALGAAHLWAGRHELARSELEDALEPKGAEGQAFLTAEKRAVGELFLALTYYRLGDKQKAKDTLDGSRARQLAEGRRAPADGPPPPWTAVVQLRVLLREANEVLSGGR